MCLIVLRTLNRNVGSRFAARGGVWMRKRKWRKKGRRMRSGKNWTVEPLLSSSRNCFARQWTRCITSRSLHTSSSLLVCNRWVCFTTSASVDYLDSPINASVKNSARDVLFASNDQHNTNDQHNCSVLLFAETTYTGGLIFLGTGVLLQLNVFPVDNYKQSSQHLSLSTVHVTRICAICIECVRGKPQPCAFHDQITKSQPI